MGLIFSIIVQGAVSILFLAISFINGFIPSSFKAPRMAHFTLAVLVLGLAHLLGSDRVLDKIDTLQSLGQLRSVDLSGNCNEDHLRICQAAQVVYRGSATLFFYFLLMATMGGAVPYVYSRLWGLKVLAVLACLGWFMFLPNPGVFGAYAEVARVVSLLWMMFQGFLVLDFSHDLHDYIGGKSEESESRLGSPPSVCGSWWRILYLCLSSMFLIAAGVGMFVLHQSYTGCKLGTFLVSVTGVVGVGTTVVSLLESVGIGLLPPSVLFAHSVFLCWYSLLSYPEAQCNPYATEDLSDGEHKQLAMWIALVLLTFTVGWCAWHGEKMLSLFGTDESSLMTSVTLDRSSKDEGEDESGSEGGSSRVFYSLVMLFASAFAAMAMTSWAQTDGEPEGYSTSSVPMESVWLKIVSQWTILLLQMRVLWVTYREAQDGAYHRF